MPTEDRRIIFNYGESYKALHSLSLKQTEAPHMIPGMIAKVEECEEDTLKLNIHIKNPQTEDNKVLVYTKDFMAASLMAYCRGLGIPLPRRAAKSIVLDKNNVILRVLVT